jgi:hypothetical protein
MKESAMVIIDGSFLMGIAAVLSSLGTLWRTVRHHEARLCPRCEKSVRKQCDRRSWKDL